jgi:hypothetical protein
MANVQVRTVGEAMTLLRQPMEGGGAEKDVSFTSKLFDCDLFIAIALGLPSLLCDLALCSMLHTNAKKVGSTCSLFSIRLVVAIPLRVDGQCVGFDHWARAETQFAACLSKPCHN